MSIGVREAINLVFTYSRQKVLEQVNINFPLIAYLVFFQIAILGIPIKQASLVGASLMLVILGLAFFMEGLKIGLMPLGEVIGLTLPQKVGLFFILVFAFLLGVGATYAEPSVGILKAAGLKVLPWDAPLLFYMLNQKSHLVVSAVGIGVGVATVLGMIRFFYSFSLKPYLYFFVPLLSLVALYCHFDPNLIFISGLAWDCGGVTTGPVTVPLVLALGIGISRTIGGNSRLSGGFGVVTLASLLPVLAIYLLGFYLNSSLFPPMAEEDFLHPKNRQRALLLFENEQKLQSFALKNGTESGIAAFFRDHPEGLSKGNDNTSVSLDGELTQPVAFAAAVRTHFTAAAQAILPLTLFLIAVLFYLREKLPQNDEILLGILLSVIGFFIFNLGIEFGLGNLGNQLGRALPSAYKTIEMVDEEKRISNFSKSVVQKSITPKGQITEFFFVQEGRRYRTYPYHEKNFDASLQSYRFRPIIGPLIGAGGSFFGILVVLGFAFLMGYGATLAEPALNALGSTVEEISIGTFKKSILMHAVALGVGVGISVGVAKIIWDIPMVYLLLPSYFFLLLVTWFSSEEFVDIAWDSAGVTTGPITVPLVLAMGLGISGQAGVVEGFGILAMASVFPILSVLGVGLWVENRHHQNLALV